MPDIDEDPFASAPADEAQAAPQPDPEPEPAADPEPAPAPAKKAAAKKAAPAAVAPVVNSEGKVVLTFKGGSGFDAPWIVIHAADLQDANDQVSGDSAKLLVDTMDKLQRAGKKFVELGGGKSAPASNGNGQASRGSAPQGATEAPSWAPPKPFDDFVYVTKVSAKTGKPWHAWMAPNKNDGRDPLFFNPPR